MKDEGILGLKNQVQSGRISKKNPSRGKGEAHKKKGTE